MSKLSKNNEDDTQNNAAKRNRGKNFSEADKEIFLDVLEGYKDTLECQITNKKSNDSKKEAWNQIADDFNCQTTNKRNASSLKSLYENLKSETKKLIAQRKRDTMETGGGKTTIPLPPIYEKMCNYMGSTIKPMKNDYDSNRKWNDMAEDDVNQDKENNNNPLIEKAPLNLNEAIEIPDGIEASQTDLFLDEEFLENSFELGEPASKPKKKNTPRVKRSKVTLAGADKMVKFKVQEIEEKSKMDLELFELRKTLLQKQIISAELEIEIKKLQLQKEKM